MACPYWTKWKHEQAFDILAAQVRDVIPDGQGVGVAGAEDSLGVAGQLLEQGQCLRYIPAAGSPVRDAAAGDQDVGVVWAQDPLTVG